MEINRERIITLSGLARDAIGSLRGYSGIDLDELVMNSEKMNAIKYQFIVLIESSIDMCNHISAKLYSKVPESYSKCFEILSENKMISGDLATKMGELAKFRNILVHLYWQVDNTQVVKKLSELGYVEQFLKEMSKLVTSSH